MAKMDPYAELPSAAHRQSSVRTFGFGEPRLGPAVMVASPRSAAVAEHEGTDLQKPLRSEKEALPVADEVDPSQVLRSSGQQLAEGPARSLSPPAAALATTGFEIGVFGNPSTIPPDTSGALNRDLVFAPHNNRVWLQGRNGEAVGDMTLDSFWNVFGHPVDTFDPKVLYDLHERRFIFVTCANAERPDSSVLVAVTTGDEPGAAWQFGEIPVDPQSMGDVWLDYPSVGSRQTRSPSA